MADVNHFHGASGCGAIADSKISNQTTDILTSVALDYSSGVVAVGDFRSGNVTYKTSGVGITVSSGSSAAKHGAFCRNGSRVE